MASPSTLKKRGRSSSFIDTINSIETDSSHHLAGPFRPQTPIEEDAPSSPSRKQSPWKRAWLETQRNSPRSKGLWDDLKTMQWVVVPSSSLKMILVPIVLYINWYILAPWVAPDQPNPFEPFLFISHRVPESPDDDPRYAKGYRDLLFIAYHIIVFSFVRQVITIKLFHTVARYVGIRKVGKLDRLGEQGYAWVYFAFFGAWGVRIMSKLPTWWYRTEYYWIDYPHWDMKPELKRYYLMQLSYWLQQLIVLTMGLEKPRVDYKELVGHHLVTLWLIGWSYLTNMTLIGNAVYVSMDIPDTFLAFSKILNYLQSKAKYVSFGIFLCVWTYFRHWLNFVILWSVLTEFDLMPESSKRWAPSEGVWMVWWMKYQIFVPILLLQFLNLFWYYFILRILYRALTEKEVTDVRSDDEDDDEEDEKNQ